MTFGTVFLVLLTACAAGGSLTKTDKRLLVTDPDVIQHRFDLLESKIVELSRQLKDHVQEEVNAGQTTYVRWGRTDCNGNSTLVYSGQIGGTRYTSTGGAANPLCMTHEVYMAEMEGAEYQDNFWGPGSVDKEAPCAVCKPNKRSSVLMIPGRNECLPGWFRKYHGYLSANAVSHPHTTTYICVDENVENLDGGIENNEGYLLYGVRARCGSLKCPPYDNDKPITCAVCSQ